MVAAASARTAADTTAILPNFSIMTRSCYFSGGEPALGLEFANRDVKTRRKLGFPGGYLAISPDMVKPRTVGWFADAFPSGLSTSTTSRAAAWADAGDLDLGQIERCPTGSKASRESAAARRRAATISDGLICSSQQTASIARRFLGAVLIKTELLQVSRKDAIRVQK